MRLTFRLLVLVFLIALVAVSAGAQTVASGHFNGRFTLTHEVNWGAVERLYPLKDSRQVFTPRGPWATASPDGLPIVLFDVETEEVYRLKWRPR